MSDIALHIWKESTDEGDMFRLEFQDLSKTDNHFFFDVTETSLEKMIVSICNFHDHAESGSYAQYAFDLSEVEESE